MNLHYNIGTALQAYALQQIIIKAGYDCDVITWARKDRLQFCDKYIKMKILPTAQDYNKIKETDYDIFVVGSDQIWRKNTNLKDYKENYINYPFLVFTNEWNKVRFSYAASFGVGGSNWQYTKEEELKLEKILAQFNAVSTREFTSVQDCKNKLNIEANQYLDPTTLLTKEDYLELCDKVPFEKNNYIFKYILQETEAKKAFINKTALDLNYEVKDYSKDSVIDWLAKMRDAKLIITDSFHGVVFSIILQKPFLYWNNRDNGNIRFETLEQLFDIKDRQITADFCLTKSILCSQNLNIPREASINYIKKYLADIPQKLVFKENTQQTINQQKKKKPATYLYF